MQDLPKFKRKNGRPTQAHEQASKRPVWLVASVAIGLVGLGAAIGLTGYAIGQEYFGLNQPDCDQLREYAVAELESGDSQLFVQYHEAIEQADERGTCGVGWFDL